MLFNHIEDLTLPAQILYGTLGSFFDRLVQFLQQDDSQAPVTKPAETLTCIPEEDSLEDAFVITTPPKRKAAEPPLTAACLWLRRRLFPHYPESDDNLTESKPASVPGQPS